MPEAIATTKRKFYRALDALSNSSTTSIHRPISETPSTSSTKRSSTAAFDEARERVRKRLRSSTSTTSLNQSTSVISLSRAKTTTKVSNAPPPNFSPWSQESFLARLKTFSSVSLWHPKPDVINEVEWAKRGWICTDVNTVACKGGCERRVVIKLDATERHRPSADEQDIDVGEEEEEAEALEEALAERFRSEIINGHASSCLWHTAGCKDDIYRLPIVRPSVWQPELKRRYRSLAGITKSIIGIATKTLESYDSTAMTGLPREVLDLEDTPDASMTKAFEIAMHGWRGSSDSGNHLLHCDACFQRIGLWMYQPDYKRQTSSDDEGQVTSINLVEMHREHCPWRSSTTQHATGSLAGLNATQTLHRVVATAARDHRRRSDRHQMEQEQERTANGEDLEDGGLPLKLSREETAERDRERESRLRKIKNLFTIKRRPTTKASSFKAA